MYWRDVYRNENSAVDALIAEERSRVPLSAARRAAAHMAIAGLVDDANCVPLGSLKSVLNKLKKLSPSHAIAKSVAPKLYKKIERIEPAGLLHTKRIPKTVSATPALPAVPASSTPLTTIAPISLPMDMSAFAPIQSGGGSAAFSQPTAPDAPAATDASAGGFSLTDPVVLLAIGGAALILFLMLKKKR